MNYGLDRKFLTLLEKCANTDQKKLRIWAVFTQCKALS